MAQGRWPLYGAAFAVTWMVGQSWPTALPGAPDGSGDDFERFYAGNEAVHLLAAVLTAIAALALVMFTRGLAHALAEVGYNRRLVPAAGLGASALFLISSVFPMIAV